MIINTAEVDKLLLEIIDELPDKDDRKFVVKALHLGPPAKPATKESDKKDEDPAQNIDDPTMKKIASLYVDIGDRKHAYVYKDEIRAIVVYTKTKSKLTKAQVIDMAKWLKYHSKSNGHTMKNVLRMTHSPEENVYVVTVKVTSIQDLEPEE